MAAIRETREETGVTCAIEGLISAVTLTWHDSPMLYLVYLARYVSGDPVPDRKETEAAAFLGLDALDRMPFDGQNAFLARRILTNEAKVLAPHQDSAWHAMYHTTYA